MWEVKHSAGKHQRESCKFRQAEHSMLAAKITLLYYIKSAKHFLSKLSSHHTFIHYAQQYPIEHILYMPYKHHPNPKTLQNRSLIILNL